MRTAAVPDRLPSTHSHCILIHTHIETHTHTCIRWPQAASGGGAAVVPVSNRQSSLSWCHSLRLFPGSRVLSFAPCVWSARAFLSSSSSSSSRLSSPSFCRLIEHQFPACSRLILFPPIVYIGRAATRISAKSGKGNGPSLLKANIIDFSHTHNGNCRCPHITEHILILAYFHHRSNRCVPHPGAASTRRRDP